MEELLIRQAEIIAPEKVELANLCIENGQLHIVPAIAGDTKEWQKKQEHYQTEQTIDAKGCYVSAGLFDLQVNGSPECSLWADPVAGQFTQLCQVLLQAGVTAFLPTLITADLEHLKKNISFLESMGITGKLSPILKKQTTNIDATKLITMPGIHLEGPFLSPQKPGVHPKQHLKSLLMPQLEELLRPSVRLMTLAPELENGKQAIEFLRQQGTIVSLGHSNASFNEAIQSFNWGVTMITHIFNALPTLHQRKPGAVLAGLLANDVYCCVICDGLHVDPNMVKLLVEIKGVDRVILVSDMAAIGTTGGELVGASITLSEAVRNIVKWGIATFPEAIKMATFNPAKAMHLDHSLGRIKEGGRADLVVWDKQTLSIKHVIANGCLVF